MSDCVRMQDAGAPKKVELLLAMREKLASPRIFKIQSIICRWAYSVRKKQLHDGMLPIDV